MTDFKFRTTKILAATLVAIAVGTIAAAPARADYSCKGTSCSCTGDTDCNKMYTNACKDNGGCNIDKEGTPTCSCTKKESIGPSPNHPKMPVAPVGKLKKSQ